MATIADLIDRARQNSGVNQAEIAARLHRSRQTVTNWKSGERVPEDDEVIALAKMADEDPDGWLAVAQAARTDGIPRKHWQAIARRLGVAAAVALCAVVVPYLIDFTAEPIAAMSIMFAAALALLALKAPPSISSLTGR